MITPEQALDINFLKANCKLIHFFGLGFIQIKLSDEQRVHVYTDKLPSTTSEEDIHNHRYDFTSQILKGSLSQRIFRVEDDRDGNFLLKRESCNEQNKIKDNGTFADVQLVSTQNFSPGSSYFISHDTFHQVASSDAITLITRSDYKKELAQVVHHYKAELICPFSIKVPEDRLWALVEEALK